MFIIHNKSIFLGVTGIIVALAIVAISVLGLPLGIDFEGGSLAEVSYPVERPEKGLVEEALAEEIDGVFSLRGSGEEGFILRTHTLTSDEYQGVLEALSLGGAHEVVEERFTSIGPVIGAELREKALFAIAIVLAVIILYIAFVFRHVSETVSSWKYGFVAIVALAHDIIVPAGAFALWAHYTGAEIDTLFVMAILAILGYSVNDTIVIFDRVRENLTHNRETHSKEPFAETVGRSLSQTFARSINTSLTTLFVLGTLFFIGGVATTDFAFTLIVGIIAGAYSSLFFAAPLLVQLAGKE